jgi:hypothetical protein
MEVRDSLPLTGNRPVRCRRIFQIKCVPPYTGKQLTITWIMCAEPEAAGRSERRMSERPPRHEAEGVRPAAGGEGTLRVRGIEFLKVLVLERD